MNRTTFTVLAVALLVVSAAVAASVSQSPDSPPATPSVTPETPVMTPETPVTPSTGGTDSADGNASSSGATASDKNAPQSGTVKSFHDIEFVWVPAGSFVPGLQGGGKSVVTTIGGRAEWFSDESARPKESFARGFWMSKTEVTRRQWSRVMGNQPWAEHASDTQLDVPATWISWKDAVAFAKTFRQEGEPECRLPSENEWEYACRAGADTLFPFGDDPAGLDEFAWYRGTATDGKPHPVAAKKPNAWGLHDMLGNVWEWCSDAYGDESAAESADLRVIRGGAANQPATFTRPTVRMGRSAKEGGARIGFRIVREP